MNFIAYRYWSKNCPLFYVESVKGKQGDWGYSTDSSKAILLSLSQAKRFANDCKTVGITANFISTI